MIVTINCESCPPIGTGPDPARVRVPKNYKKEEVIKAYRLEHAVEAWESMAVDVFAAQVFCITWMAEGDEAPTCIMHNDERTLLTSFASQLEGWAERAKGLPIVWVTYNGLKFDFPMLYLRAIKYDIGILARQLRPSRGRWQDETHIDVYDMLGASGSLDDWITFFGLTVDNPITGDQVNQAKLRQQYDLIVRHSSSRVIGAAEIYKKLKTSGVV